MKCFKLVFRSKIFKNYKGNIIALVYFGIYCISPIIHFIKGISILKNDLSQLIINVEPKGGNNSINNNKCNEIKHKEKIIELKNNISIIKRRNKKIILRKDLSKKKIQPKIVLDFPPQKTH